MALRKRDGFMGERSIVLPPMVVEQEEKDPLVSSLYITDIGYYPCAEHHYRSRQQPINQYVLIYCVEGNGWYKIEDKEYQVHKNQYFILPAGKAHAYGTYDDGWTIYWIHFRGEHAAVYSEGAQVPRDINITLNSRLNNRNNIFDEIFNTIEKDFGIESLRYASSLLHHYLASMRYLEQYRLAGRMDDKTVIDAAIHYMRENIEKRITLQDIVKYVGYSPSHFSAMFKNATGMSTLSYFNKLKVERACYLLDNTNLKINQICFKVGFDDSLYFSRLFSKTMGISPRQYREEKNK